jgi:hypothetical protein
LSEMFSLNEKSFLMICAFCPCVPGAGATTACQQHVRLQVSSVKEQLTLDANDVLSLLALRLRLLNAQTIHVFEHARLKVHRLDLRGQENKPCDEQALDDQAAHEGKNTEEKMRCEEYAARRDRGLDCQLKLINGRGILDSHCCHLYCRRGRHAPLKEGWASP